MCGALLKLCILAIQEFLGYNRALDVVTCVQFKRTYYANHTMQIPWLMEAEVLWLLAGVHTVGWLEGEDPGERKKGEVGQGDQSLFICFSNLPGAEASAEGSVTPETFPWPGSTVCAKSY